MCRENLISVIVPVYNIEKYLPRCLQSISEQTYTNLEIIVIDDGSTDSSGKIADEFAKKDDRFVVIHKENGGVGSARNVGIANVHGEFIGFVDGDDYINSEMYRVLYENIKKSEYDISGCYYRGASDDIIRDTKEFVDYDNQQTIELNNYELFNHYYNGKEIEKKNNIYTTSFLALWNKLYKKEVFNGIVFPENVYTGEDLYVYFDILKNTSKSIFTDLRLYYYYRRKNSLTNQKKTYEMNLIRIENRGNAIKRYLNVLSSLGYNELYNTCINSELFDFFNFATKEDSLNEVKNIYRKKTMEIIDLKKLNKYFSIKKRMLILLFIISPKLYKKIVS